jgi:hypothetical protein
MKNLVAFPVLFLVLMIQTAIVSRLPLLSGAADLMLLTLAAFALQPQVTESWQWGLLGGLFIALTSALPFFVPLIGYLALVILARVVLRRVWQVPILAMFVVVFVGTLFVHILSFVALRVVGNPISFNEAFSLITLPTMILNLLLAVPMYTFVRDLAGWLYPVAERA